VEHFIGWLRDYIGVIQTVHPTRMHELRTTRGRQGCVNWAIRKADEFQILDRPPIPTGPLTSQECLSFYDQMLIAALRHTKASKPDTAPEELLIGYAGIYEIMQKFKIPPSKYDALDGRLKRLRRKSGIGAGIFIEAENCGRNQPRFLYRLTIVAPLIADLSSAPDKRPTEDFPPKK
jgi:hypothetical protein